jgi:hypothetical protein
VPDALKNNAPWFALALAAIGGYLGGHAIADSLSHTSLSTLSGFFTAAATVLGAILIALALGATIADPADGLAPVLLAVVVAVVIGLIASVYALAPGVSRTLIRQLFALTMAAGLVSLAGVLLVAFTAVFLSAQDREAAWRKRLAGAGVPTDGP